MRRVLFILASVTGALCSASQAADPHEEPACLPPADTLEVVRTHQVVSPSEALVHVRHAVPGADVLRAALCHGPDALVYRVTLLTHEGRVVRAVVDAHSGKLRSVH